MLEGIPAGEGAKYLREMVPAVQKLWQGDYEHKGECWNFPVSTSVPKPLQKKPAMWIAARDRDPAGISTQDPELMKRLDPVEGGRKLANYLNILTLEAQTLARACGKNDLRNLELEDLVALTVESAAMASVPLAGTGWIPGQAY